MCGAAADDKFDFEEFCSLYKKKRQSEDARKEELLLCVNTLFPTNGDNNDSIDLEKVLSLFHTLFFSPGLLHSAIHCFLDLQSSGEGTPI